MNGHTSKFTIRNVIQTSLVDSITSPTDPLTETFLYAKKHEMLSHFHEAV